MGVASCILQQLWSNLVVVLAKFNTLLFCFFDQKLVNPIKQVLVGWVGDALCHHDGVQHHSLQHRGLEQFEPLGCLQRLSEWPLGALFPNLFAPFA
jgi:hypothetical protein